MSARDALHPHSALGLAPGKTLQYIMVEGRKEGRQGGEGDIQAKSWYSCEESRKQSSEEGTNCW